MSEHFLKVEERILSGPQELIPFFWRVLRKAAQDPEKLVLNGVHTEFVEIYQQLMTRYEALSLRDCPVTMPVMFRRILLRELPAEAAAKWGSYSTYQKSFFTDRYFIEPVENSGYRVSCNFSEIASLSVYPDGTGNSLEAGSDFAVYKGTLMFKADPFRSDSVFSPDMYDSVVRTPWGEQLEYRELVLYAVDAQLNEVPVTSHYGSLVLDSDQIEQFEESENYGLIVYSLFRVFYTGSTDEALQYFANILAGSPVIEEDGERVVKIEATVSGGTAVNRITTDRNVYDIPYYILPSQWMIPGQKLTKDTPVGEFITITDYHSDPDWIHGYEAGDSAYLVNKTTGIWDAVKYDLTTRYTHEDIETVPVSQRPRFDLTPVSSLGLNEFPTGTYGLWHSVVGPTYIRFRFNDPYTSEKTVEQFNFILREILSIDILYSVEITEEDPDALLDHLGGKLLDHLGEVLLGS